MVTQPHEDCREDFEPLLKEMNYHKEQGPGLPY